MSDILMKEAAMLLAEQKKNNVGTVPVLVPVQYALIRHCRRRSGGQSIVA